MFSDSYNFLEAVRDRDGNQVTQIIETPGSTLINTRDLATGDTALHIVAERRDTVWIRFLTQKGANPNIANKAGVTPLMISASLGNTEGVEALIKAGARHDEGNNLGETPLITATHQRNIEMVKLLLSKGADPDRNDNSGRSARDYAEAIGSKRLTMEFEAADAARDGKEQTDYGPRF
ncbi:hypothetical protein ELI_00175 [Erythrobacter litoralis HTCC2594]|uniref:Uncharacterized protein n=2 Tax=Erythrobacter litoralis TaxID=39960 RepID=Q2NDW4_ERYLH|nr:hypothetical protein ELI_00175 [Erythrobacter litoralis HTCC2594]